MSVVSWQLAVVGCQCRNGERGTVKFYEFETTDFAMVLCPEGGWRFQPGVLYLFVLVVVLVIELDRCRPKAGRCGRTELNKGNHGFFSRNPRDR